jgi:hypothetical protein
VKSAAKSKPKLAKKGKKTKKTKLSQTKARGNNESDMEAEITGDVSDEQATAAATKAVQEAQ